MWKCYYVKYHQDFSTYFDGVCTHVRNGSFTDSKNYCVEECFFKNLNNRAVYSSGDCNFLFEDSSFISVSSQSGAGGAVYTSKVEHVHNRICSINCSTTSAAHYCFSWSSKGLNKNYIIESSISMSSKNPIGHEPLSFYRGIQYESILKSDFF